MQLLKERILKDGKVYPGNVLKVSGFLNQLIDEKLVCRRQRNFHAVLRS